MLIPSISFFKNPDMTVFTHYSKLTDSNSFSIEDLMVSDKRD